MGTFADFNIGHYKTDAFVETGTCQGANVIEAMKAGFKDIYSVELSPKLHGIARENIQAHLNDAPGASVVLYCGDSREALTEICKKLQGVRVTFRLEAHSHVFEDGTISSDQKTCSLLEELDAIGAAMRASVLPVILINDVSGIRKKADCNGHDVTVDSIIQKIISIDPGYSFRFLNGSVPDDMIAALPPDHNRPRTPKSLYEMSDDKLTVNHNAGIFSCYTIRLEAILDYYRTYNRVPAAIDCSRQFAKYKDAITDDVSDKFFQARFDIEIPCAEKKIFTSSDPAEQQFSDYSNLNFSDIKPFVEKYFCPSDDIMERISRLSSEMPWPYEDVCGIRYRGTDKSLETNQPSYAEFILRAFKLKKNFAELKFMILTDDEEFREYAIRELGDDAFSHSTESSSKLEASLDFVANIFAFSKCKYMITTSGNAEFWIRLFRGNNEGSIQWLSPKEYIYGTKNRSFNPDKKYFWIDHERLAF